MKFLNTREFKLWGMKQLLNLQVRLILKFLPKTPKRHLSMFVFSGILQKYKQMMEEVYSKQAVRCDRNFLNLLDATERVIVYLAERDGYYESTFWFLLEFLGIHLQRYVPRVNHEKDVIWKIKVTSQGEKFEVWGELVDK